MATNKTTSIKVTTAIKAGGLTAQHNRTLRSRSAKLALKVTIALKAAASPQHNRSLLAII